jgi:hypothetical protein
MALMALIRRAINRDLADTQVPPTVMISIDLDDLLKATGRGDLLNTGEHIDAETARRLACDARITRVITGPDGEILDLGRTTRNPPPKFKRALGVRDGHCVFPGCRMPPNKCSPAPHPVVGKALRSHLTLEPGPALPPPPSPRPRRRMDHDTSTGRHPRVPKTRRQRTDHLRASAFQLDPRVKLG